MYKIKPALRVIPLYYGWEITEYSGGDLLFKEDIDYPDPIVENFNDEASRGTLDTNSEDEFSGSEITDLPSEDDIEGFVNRD